MMKKHGLFIYILIGLLLTQYQNCAPPQNSLDSSVVNDEGLVEVIDQVQVGEIFFAEKTVHASSLGSSELFGICEQNGAIISWTLRHSDGRLLERGSSECERGSFAVVLTSDVQSQCGGDLQLKAALGVKASSEITIITDCAI